MFALTDSSAWSRGRAPLPPQHGQHFAQALDQHLEGYALDQGPADEDHRHIGWKSLALSTVGFPEPPPRAVSLDGAAELPAHGEPSLSSARGGDPQRDELGPLHPLAPLE